MILVFWKRGCAKSDLSSTEIRRLKPSRAGRATVELTRHDCSTAFETDLTSIIDKIKAKVNPRGHGYNTYEPSHIPSCFVYLDTSTNAKYEQVKNIYYLKNNTSLNYEIYFSELWVLLYLVKKS